MKIRECTRHRCLLAVLSALLIATIAMTGCSNPEKAKAEYVKRGEAYLKDKRYQEASIEFRNALQIDDEMAAAHWGLAQAYEGLMRYTEALAELQRTINLDPNHLDARVRLGNFYLVAGQIAEAERLAKEVLGKDPNHIEGHILMAGVLVAQDKRGEALAELNRAIELDAKRIESYLALARFYIKTVDGTKAEETFKRAISINDSSGLAHTEYGKFLAQMNRLDEAEAEFKRAIEVEPSNRDSRFVLASFYLVHKQLDKAEAAYRALAELDKDRPDGRSVLADFYSAVGRYDEAVAIYQEILQTAPDNTRARYRLGEIHLQRGDARGASAQVEEILKKNAQDMQARLLRARINLHNSDPRKAIEDLKDVLRQEPNSRAGLYFMAEACFRDGQVELARSYAAELERYYPDYLPAKLMQVQINLASNDAKSALRLANELVERLTKAGPDRDTSPQLLQDLRARSFTARGTAQLSLGNIEGARADFISAQQETPNAPHAYINLAAVAVRDNKPEEAIGFYERALAIDSVNFDGLYGLINVYAQQKRVDLAHARVDQALGQQPNNASLHYLKAQVYGFEQNAQGAETELRRTIELNPDYLAAYSDLGNLFVNLKQTDRAIAEYRKIIDRKPDNAAAYTLIGMLEEGRQNMDAAEASYRKALELDQNATIAANNLAWLYAVHGKGNLDEAVRLAQGVVQRYPDVSGFADTLGWVYYKKGLHAAAVEQLQKAVARDGDNATYRYHLGMALAGKGDKAGARRELEQALRLSEKSGFSEATEARRTLATL